MMGFYYNHTQIVQMFYKLNIKNFTSPNEIRQSNSQKIKLIIEGVTIVCKFPHLYKITVTCILIKHPIGMKIFIFYFTKRKIKNKNTLLKHLLKKIFC